MNDEKETSESFEHGISEEEHKILKAPMNYGTGEFRD